MCVVQVFTGQLNDMHIHVWGHPLDVIAYGGSVKHNHPCGDSQIFQDKQRKSNALCTLECVGNSYVYLNRTESDKEEIETE